MFLNFPTSPIKLKLGLHISWTLLTATHLDQSNYLANQQQQVLGFALPFTSLHKMCKILGQTILLSQTRMFWVSFMQFSFVESHNEQWLSNPYDAFWQWVHQGFFLNFAMKPHWPPLTKELIKFVYRWDRQVDFLKDPAAFWPMLEPISKYGGIIKTILPNLATFKHFFTKFLTLAKFTLNSFWLLSGENWWKRNGSAISKSQFPQMLASFATCSTIVFGNECLSLESQMMTGLSLWLNQF